MTREESMRRHPAGRARAVGLVSEARRWQARDVADRLLVEVDEFMGGPAVVVPESPEVAQARMDDEACEVGSSNAAPRPAAVGPVVETLRAFVAGGVVYAIICGVCLAGEVFGGWPA